MITSKTLSQDSFPFLRKTKLGAVYYHKASSGQSNHIYVSNGSLKMAIAGCFAFFIIAIIGVFLLLMLAKKK